MNLRTAIKHFSITTGLYGPARAIYRVANRPRLAEFRRELDFYSRLVTPNSLCFDVGANVGVKSELLLEAGARVVAFEPQTECMRELRARCKRFGDRLASRQSAVGSTEGKAVLHIRESRGQSSLLEDWEGVPENEVTVPVTTLDRVIAEFGAPFYCKIDVEGFELEVLKGLSQAVPLISFEYHLRDREIETTRACLDYLGKLGDLHINAIPSHLLAFEFEEWLTPSDFYGVFPESFRNRKGYFYGDIFVRMG
jgi:FkbM family methyltransferase